MKAYSSTRAPIRFLMLEDNLADAELALRNLIRSGLHVDASVVRTAPEFQQKLHVEKFDIVLCDFTLPGWSGLDALHWLRQSGYEIPFIYVSGTLGEDTAVECIKQGATDYVLKNNLERLPHAVQRALDESELRRQRARAEQELAESEEQYRLLFESNPQPMWVFDRKTLAFLAVNEAAIRHYGYSRQEFLQKTILDIRLPEDVVPVLRTVLQNQIAGLQSPEVWRHRLKDGRVIVVEITSHGLIFQGCEAELIMANDVTETRRNQEQLQQSEERFAKAFRSCPLAITISTLAEGRYLDANDAFLRMIGYTREELLGHRASELNIWAFLPDRETMIHQLDRAGRVNALETVFNSRATGTRTVQLFAERVHLDGVPCVLAITHDVTDAKRLEEQFRQAQKMEVVGRLAGGVAHDFNNMLGIILGYCDLAEERPGGDATKRDVEQIRKAATRAANLTRELLAFSRQQILRPSFLNLNSVVHDLNLMLQRVLPSNIELIFRSASHLGNIKADLGQIEQILVNMVVNARDAMVQGGKIVIETENLELDETYVRQQPGVCPGSHVLLSISDTGCGMNEETLSRIFEPFFTTKPRGEGSGLGLSMVYGAVQENGGHIKVSSELGVGTTFRLYFPRVKELETRPVIAPPVTVTRGAETVLVVEDESALCELVVEVLEKNGYTVLQASNGPTAIDVSMAYGGSIHVLLADVMLPGMNGDEVAVRLLESRPDLRVLYMSGNTVDLITNQRLLQGRATIIEKPFTRQSLLCELRALLDRQEVN
jgi:two-component system, cell cycle sensor histidine kinase and response regulator CckA